MKLKTVFVCAIMLMVACASVFAAGQKDKKAPKLDGAYKYVSTKFPGGQQTEAENKGMIVVHDKYMSFVCAQALIERCGIRASLRTSARKRS